MYKFLILCLFLCVWELHTSVIEDTSKLNIISSKSIPSRFGDIYYTVTNGSSEWKIHSYDKTYNIGDEVKIIVVPRNK